MSFAVTLMKTYYDENHIDKEPTTIINLTGVLKDSTSILNPIILCEVDMSTVINVNYMYINAFSRYYYVDDIVSVKNGLIELHGRVDVLMSYKTEILAQSAIITRQENDWNLYLNDGSFHTYQDSIVLTKAFPSGFTTQEFVLAVAGGDSAAPVPPEPDPPEPDP